MANIMRFGGGTSTGSGSYGTLPAQVINFYASGGNAQVTLTWVNPSDSNFAGAAIVRKTGGYPASPTDGTKIYTGTAQTFNDTGLTNDTQYYYRAFAYNSKTEYQTIYIVATAVPVPYHTYGVVIDTTNSNPETSVTYLEGAVGMTGGSADWHNNPIFESIKPCLLKNGVVQYYLNPDDLTKKVDGTDSVLTGADGDVMVEIPKMGLKMVNDSANNKQYVYITDNPNAIGQGFHYYAHTRDTEGDRDKLYIGAYLGQYVSSKLHSYSGVAPTRNVNLTNFRTYAQANGAGYDLVSFYPLTLLQALYVIKYKSLDSQTALGQGLVNGSVHATGTTNSLGRDYGTTSPTQQMCFQNIEDFWGNLRWWIDGYHSNSDYHILTSTNNFNDSGNGYTDYGQITQSNIQGYMSLIQGNSEMGFTPKTATGSSTTYYSDGGMIYANSELVCGGRNDDTVTTGVFYFCCTNIGTTGVSNTGARLMYL